MLFKNSKLTMIQSTKTFFILVLCLFGSLVQMIESKNDTKGVASSSSMSGGLVDPIEEHPYVVSLQLDGKHFCIGTVLNREFVLTACHCVKNLYELHNFRVLLRTLDSTYSYMISAIYRHPEFAINREGNMIHNLALIKLTSLMDGNIKKKYIELFDENETVGPNTEGIVVGLRAKVVQKEDSQHQRNLTKLRLKVPVNSNSECINIYKHRFILTDHQICAGNLNSPTGPCSRDSGAPLIVKKRQIGVLSEYPDQKEGCSNFYEKPPIYTLVAAHRKWINEIIPELKKIEVDEMDPNLILYIIIGSVSVVLLLVIVVLFCVSQSKKT